jgi:hypothetical protein
MEFEWKVSKKDRRLPIKTYIAISVVSVLIAVHFIFNENYFGAILFVIAPALLLIINTQGQRETVGKISEKEIRVNNHSYKYIDLDFFDIIDDNLVLKLKQQNGNDHAVYVQIKHSDADKIENALYDYIPRKEYEESLTEITNRFLRLH